jgi:hypothetical protein
MSGIAVPDLAGLTWYKALVAASAGLAGLAVIAPTTSRAELLTFSGGLFLVGMGTWAEVENRYGIGSLKPLKTVVAWMVVLFGLACIAAALAYVLALAPSLNPLLW